MVDKSEYMLQRGSNPVAVEPEEEYFTVALSGPDDEARAAAALAQAGVPSEGYRRVGKCDLRVKVKAEDLQSAMAKLSGEQKLVCQRAYRPADSENARYYLGNRVCIRFKDPVGASGAAALLSSLGIPSTDIDIYEVPGRESRTIAVTVRNTQQRDALNLASDVAGRAGVLYAEPDTIERFRAFPGLTGRADAPRDEPFRASEDLFRYQWYLDATASPLLQRFPDQLIAGAGISLPEA